MRKIKEDERGMAAWRLHLVFSDFPDGSAGKESTFSIGDTGDIGSIPESGRSPGRGNGILL